MEQVLSNPVVGEFFLVVVGSWIAKASIKQRRLKKESKTIRAVERIHKEHQNNVDDIFAKSAKPKWYHKVFPEPENKVHADGFSASRIAKTYRGPADLEQFTGFCQCPMCGDINLHWLGNEAWLIRQTRDGQEQDRVIGRECRHCKGTWSQLI